MSWDLLERLYAVRAVFFVAEKKQEPIPYSVQGAKRELLQTLLASVGLVVQSGGIENSYRPWFSAFEFDHSMIEMFAVILEYSAEWGHCVVQLLEKPSEPLFRLC